MSAATGHIFSLQISNGGVPKLPIREGIVSALGLQGDRQRDKRHHGGPDRALCLFSLEEILQLQAEGHPIYPGSTGENVTISGLNWADLPVGTCLELGDEVLARVTGFAAPCTNIRESFVDAEITRISQKVHPGESRLYVRVLRPGTIRVGQSVRVMPEAVETGQDAEALRYDS